MGLLRRSLSSVRWRSLWVFLPWDCLASPFHTEASAAHFHTEDKRDTRAHYADLRFSWHISSMCLVMNLGLRDFLLVASYVAFMLPQLAYSQPAVMIQSTRPGEYRQLGEFLEMGIDSWMRRARFGRVNSAGKSRTP